MFAIIESLGRQYKVSVGDIIKVDRIIQDNETATPGSKIIFTQVLMLSTGNDDSKVGAPYIQGAQVTGELVANGKEKKVFAFKKKRRQGYHKKIGFRRPYAEVVIKEIKAA